MAGVNVGEAFVTIRPDTQGFQDDTTTGVNNALKGAASAFAATMVAAKIKDFIGGAIDEATEATKVTAQTAAVIKSTGGAANVTAEQIGKLAEKLSLKTAIDDEAIQSGQNMLLTFTNVRNEVAGQPGIFDRATKAALNMSVAMGTDMTGAAMQVGKALNDPIAGATALRRAGVQLSDAQEEQIKGFMAVNDLASAQKIILGELETQFGGSAEAQATAGEKLQVAYANLKEEIGMALLPIMQKLVNVLLPLIAYLKENKSVLMAVAGVIGGALVAAFVAWTISAMQAAAATIAATWPILAIGAAAAAVGAIILYVWKNWNQVWTWIQDHKAYAAIIAIMSPFLATIVGVTLAVRYLYDHWGTIWPKIQEITATVVEAVRPYVEKLVSIIQTVVDVLVVLGKIVWEVMKAVWDAISWIAPRWWDMWKTVYDVVNAIVDFISGMPERVANVGVAIAKAIGNGFVDAFNTIANTINDIIPNRIPLPFGMDIDLDDDPLPTLRRFHSGGMVPGLPGQEMLAILRAGERVVPAGEPALPGDGMGLTVQGDLVIQDRDILGTLDYWARTRMAGV